MSKVIKGLMNNVSNNAINADRELFIKKVEEGLAQIKAGQTFTHEQVKQKIREWTSDKTK